ncbi:diaminopimelate decarboxylase [Microbulbifer sp. SAOS-129_SWC]|uniref:diaminopimelate decarboxylase n=1 Tax=Microbulbifer sp. SAOS-129_SWC TaxID=3145235 RepID=UPI003216F968
MSDFNYRDGSLWAEDVPLQQIAEQFGTPTYVYSRAHFETQYRAYADALGDHPGLICYAVKANSNLGILSTLVQLGAGFDIVSGGELERVLLAGGDPARIVFSGVGKTADEMRRALAVGVHCFNVESAAELDRLEAVAAELDVRAPVSLRVNPDVDAKTHPYISTGLKENKFGIAIDSAPMVYRRAAASANLDVVGVDCHIGSQLTELAPFLDALDRLLVLIDQLAGDGIRLKHLDLGGGLGVRYRGEEPPPVSDYLGAIKERLGERQLALVLEPGRSIAANGGLLLSRVEFLKRTDEHNFAIVDAAMNDNLRPALYQAWQDIVPVTPNNGEVESWDIVGPVCETADFLGKRRELALQPGQLLAMLSAGAYGFSMSSNYNTRPRAAEVLVDGERTYLVRARESFADLVRGESPVPERVAQTSAANTAPQQD